MVERLDAFILDVVNNYSNRTPNFVNDEWIIWSKPYDRAGWDLLKNDYIGQRFVYILKNMWPVECENIEIEARIIEDTMNIVVLKSL